MAHFMTLRAVARRLDLADMIVPVMLALAAAIGGLGAAALMQMRGDSIDSASEAGVNLALTLERSITRNLQINELAIRGVIDTMHDANIMAMQPRFRQHLLFDRSINAEDMGALLVTDAMGSVILDSQQWPPRPTNIADRDFFEAHRQATGTGVYLSRPFPPPFTPENKSVALSRRVSNPDGSFAGIVVGVLPLMYFRKLFDGVSLGAGGTLTLVRTDGTVIMRRPHDDASIGRDISGSTSFAPLLRGEQGSFLGVAALDGQRRLYSYRRTPGYPLIVVVGRSVGHVLAPWYRRLGMFAGLIAAVDILLVTLAVMLSRQWRRRAAMESQLRWMVDTDGLTGLGSRRALDDAADREWRRARRDSAPISLLMLDVDYFKQFNDQYGHLAGDDALARVGNCILQQIRRPGDYAGRYGGEEFAIILPGTGVAGAVAVAENVRAAVQHLRIPNERSPLRQLTVSIGRVTDLACALEGRTFAELRAFFLAGDEALYVAKREGRNRVVGHPASSSTAPKSDVLA